MGGDKMEQLLQQILSFLAPISGYVKQSIDHINTLTGSEPMLTAVVLGLFSTVVTGVVGFVLWKAPTTVLDILRKRFLISLEIVDIHTENSSVFTAIEEDVNKHSSQFLTRTFSLLTQWKMHPELQFDYLSHVFGFGNNQRTYALLRGRLCYVTCEYDIKSYRPSKTMTITTYGLTKEFLEDYIKSVLPKPTPPQPRHYVSDSYGGWDSNGTLRGSGFKHLALNPETKKFSQKLLLLFLTAVKCTMS